MVDVFNKVAIIGVGVIGGSLGLSLKRKHPELSIIGISREETIHSALEIGAIDVGYPREKMTEVLADVDLVFICAPIAKIIDLLPLVSRAIKPGALVSDVGSTKGVVVDTASRIFPKDKYFIGGHPMAGNEGHGVSWADPLLFENAVYVLTPVSGTPTNLTDRFGNFLESTGAKVLCIEPHLHDRIAAAVSHLPQILAVTLMNFVTSFDAETEPYLRLAAGGFRDMTRIASSPFDMWRDIFATNNHEIISLIDLFIGALQETKQKLSSENMADSFAQSAASRLSIPHDTKGFLRPNFDLTVQVEDKPGVIASIANALMDESINIKDIEVLKIREGDSGMIRLAFESDAKRNRARELLSTTGYTSMIR